MSSFLQPYEPQAFLPIKRKWLLQPLSQSRKLKFRILLLPVNRSKLKSLKLQKTSPRTRQQRFLRIGQLLKVLSKV